MVNNYKTIFMGILFLGLVLRIIGIDFGLPYVYHQDEPIVVNHALAIGAGGWNTGVYWPPQFASYLLFIFYAVSFLLGKSFGFFQNAEAFAIEFLKDPTFFYLLGRLVMGVTFGVATVWAIGRFGKKYFSKETGLWASLFLSVSLIHVQQSHYIYVDIPLAFALTLLYGAWLNLLKGFSFNKALAVGAIFGFAIAVKYTTFYLAPVFILLHILIFRGRVLSRQSFLGWVAEAASAIAVYALISPFSLLEWRSFLEQAAHQSGARGYMGWSHHLLYSVIQGTSPLLFILAAAGFLYSLKFYRKESILLGSTALLYYIVNVYFTQPFARYMMPLIPLVCLWAALGCVWITSRIKSGYIRSAVLGAVFISALAPSVYSDFLFLRKDTRTQCLEWIGANYKEGAVIVVDNRFQAPQLVQTKDQIEEKYAFLEIEGGDKVKKKRLDLMRTALQGKRTYNVHTLSTLGSGEGTFFLFERPFIKANLEEFRERKVDLFIINYSDVISENHAFKDLAANQLGLLAVFSPYWSEDQKISLDPYATTAAPHGWWELFSRKRLGPYLEVYKILK